MRRTFSVLLWCVVLFSVLAGISACGKQEVEEVGSQMELILTDKFPTGALFEDDYNQAYSISRETLETYLEFDDLLERQIVTVTYQGGIRETSPATFGNIIHVKIGKQ